MATKASRIALAGSNISSTGEVDADLLDNIDSSAFLSLDSNGRLGIGTSSPSDKLEVSRESTDQTVGLTLTNIQNGGYGSGIVWKSKRSDNSNVLTAAEIVVVGENAWNSDSTTSSQIQFKTQKDNTLTQHMTLTKNGNLGIGTTNPTNTYGPVLHIRGNNPNLRLDGTGSGSWAWISMNTADAGDSRAMGTASDGTFRITNVRDNLDSGIQFAIKQDGNVGIGTTSPTSILSIEKNSSRTTDFENMLKITHTSSGTTGVGFGSAIYFLGERENGGLQGMGRLVFDAEVNSGSDISSGFSVQTATAGSTSEKFRITHNGKVLVGTTTNSYNRAKLTVFGAPGAPATSGTSTTNVGLRLATTTGNSQAMDFGIYNAAPYGGWIQASNSGGLQTTSPIALNPNGGNVGINTTNPVAQFAVGGAGKRIEIQGTDCVIRGFDRTASWQNINFEAAGYVFDCGGSERMRIDSSGRVTTPSQPAFHAYGTGNSISDNTIVQFKTELFDEGGNYNTTNGRFTAPVAGKYLFGWTGIGNNANDVYRYYILINGSKPYGGDVHFRQDTSDTGSAYGTNGMYCIPVSLSASDYVQIQVITDNSATWYGSADALNEYWRFWGYLIG